MSLRKALYVELEPSARDRPGLSSANLIIIALVLLSFLTLALETEPTLTAGWRLALAIFNILILAVFAVEYCVRLWIAGEEAAYRGPGGRVRYAFTPFAMIDLVAFLPELVWLLVMPDGEGGFLMTLRVLRLARLIKIARFVPAFDVLGAAVRRSGSQLFTTFAMALALVYVSAVMLYYIEGVGQGRDAFASIPRATWWAIATLTTVGYGDVYPVTTLGRIAAAIISLAGIGVVALPAGVFASAFSDELREREERKTAQDAAEATARALGNTPRK
jgi:voltage-gated potassium channel